MRVRMREFVRQNNDREYMRRDSKGRSDQSDWDPVDLDFRTMEDVGAEQILRKLFPLIPELQRVKSREQCFSQRAGVCDRVAPGLPRRSRHQTCDVPVVVVEERCAPSRLLNLAEPQE